MVETALGGLAEKDGAFVVDRQLYFFAEGPHVAA